MLPILGAFFFGIVIGWVTKEILTRAKVVGVGHLAAIVGAVGGAAVTAIFNTKPLFGAYCIGLAIGFFTYLLLLERIDRGIRAVVVDMEAARNQELFNKILDAKTQILSYLEHKKLKAISFERIQENITPDYSDKFLRQVVLAFPDELRFAKLRGDKRGLACILEEEEESTAKIADAKAKILLYLEEKKVISFERVREKIDPNYSDEFLRQVILSFPDELRFAKLRDGKHGLARVPEEIQQ